MTDSKTVFTKERAQTYDKRVRQAIAGYEVLHELSEVVLSNELPEKASLLIVGAGTGVELLAYGAKHPKWIFTAQDPAETMLSIAKEKVEAAQLTNRVTFHAKALDEIPGDELFDAGTLLLVLHFLTDDDQRVELLSSILNLLKPGAPLLLANLFGDTESTRYKKMMTLSKAWAIRKGMDPAEAETHFSPTRPDLGVISEERLKGLLRTAGYIDVQRYFQGVAFGAWIARSPR